MIKKFVKLKIYYKIIVSIVIGIAIIAFWRGIWGLQDLYLFPDNLPLSFAASTVIGLGILLGTNYIVKALAP